MRVTYSAQNAPKLALRLKCKNRAAMPFLAWLRGFSDGRDFYPLSFEKHGFPCFFDVLSLICRLRAHLPVSFSRDIMIQARTVPRKNCPRLRPRTPITPGAFLCGLVWVSCGFVWFRA